MNNPVPNARGAHKFYPVVDGLRAIAVSSVVLYHAGASWLPGGFVGVDIFFVISGFLIIGHIYEQLQAGRFTFREFWARRAVRILPPYLILVLTTLLVAQFVLVTPEEFKELGRQAMYSAWMLVNHHFLAMEGYFDTSSELKPLLHLWSLSVEEQFYLFTPLLIGLAWFVGRKLPASARTILFWSLATVLFAASLYLCIRFTNFGGKNYAFYLMPLRAWQFMAGGAAYFLLPAAKRLSPRLLAALVVLGLTLIVWPVLRFGHSTPFPSYFAAAPTLGTALVIVGGICAPTTLPARMLSVRPMLWIGLVSYSWYLWHWPTMVFARIYNFESLPLSWGLAAAAVSLLLATLTYRFVELPAKTHWQPYAKRAGLRVIAIGVLSCLAVSGMSHYVATQAAASRESDIPPSFTLSKATDGGDCRLQKMKGTKACKKQIALHGASTRHFGLLLGDSHSRALTSVITRRAIVDHNTTLVTMVRNGCNPIDGVARHHVSTGKQDNGCQRDKKEALDLVRNGTISPDFALIASYWDNYPALSKRGEERPADDQHGLFVQYLVATLKDLRKAGVERILVVGPVPVMPTENPAACVLRSLRYDMLDQHRCSISAEANDRQNQESMSRLREAVAQVDGVRLIDPTPVFCDTRYCPPYRDGTLLYRDDDHISDTGAALLYAHFRSDFKWLMDGSRH